MIWDFFLVQLDPTKFHLFPEIMFWKSAALIAAIGYFCVLYAIDRKVLAFKFKGIFAYIVLIAGLFQFFYPVSMPEDFELVDTVGLLGNVVAIVIPIIFIYIAIKTPGLRKTSLMIAIGVIIYAIGANLVVESILVQIEAAFGPNTRTIMYFLFLVFKTTGLLLFSNGVTKFSL